MPTIQEVRDEIQNNLTGMGYTPYSLIITEVITEMNDGNWQIKGEFQSGFMGDNLKFEMKYEPETRGIRNLKVYPMSSRGGYA
jgi:hypothetical protein